MSGSIQSLTLLAIWLSRRKHDILVVDFEVLIHVMKDSNKLSQGTEKSDYSLLEYRAILFGIDGLEPCFLVYFSSRNPKKATVRHILSQI
jgi:hypothetical protein